LVKPAVEAWVWRDTQRFARPRGGVVVEIYTTGKWQPKPGSEDAFVQAWSEFAAWASGVPGAGALRLTRDVRDPKTFLSFGAWDSIDSVRAWKGDPGFRERMGRLQQHVHEFEPSELAVVATAEAGNVSVSPSPTAGIEPAHAG
jgi:heme-degrading monooxygenase HmoA